MELKSGYKQTDVGQIPDDWEIRPICEIAPLQRGIDLPTSQIRPGSVPVVYSNGVMSHHNVSLVNGPGVVTGRSGTLGKIHYIESDYWPHNTSLWVTDFHENNPRFVYYLYQHIGFERFGSGSGVPTLNRNDVHSFQVAIPSDKTEQGVIAAALSDVDELIESLEQLIAKKRLIKQGVLSCLFSGQFRLPGFTDKWDLMKIGEFTDCAAGGTPSTKIQEYWDGDIPWMSSGELNQKNVYEVEGRITESGLRNSSTHLLPVGCILVGLAGQGRTRGTVAMNHIPLCTNQSIAAIFPNSSFDPYFLFYNLELRYEELRELSAGDGGRGGLNLTIIRNIQIPFPSIVEQKAIAAALFDMDREITEIRNNIDKARSMKLGMMQQLLTGKIRLVSPQVKILSSIKKEAHTVKANSHSIEFEDAVIIAVLAACFATAQWPLSRFRYTKFSYLLRRRSNKAVDSYLKKAAGPYNPRTRYGGPERITVQKGYSQKHSNGTYSGFLAGENIEEAEKYFETWFGKESLTWLKQFQFDKHDRLELLTTVDLAMVELRKDGSEVSLESVKRLIHSEPEWAPKLDRSIFSDVNIDRAINWSASLFGA